MIIMLKSDAIEKFRLYSDPRSWLPFKTLPGIVDDDHQEAEYRIGPKGSY